MYILELSKKLISNTSLEVLTAFATTGATFFAWRTTSVNKKQSKEQIDEQHRVERPRIIPLNTDIFLTNSRPSPSWTADNGEILSDNSYRLDELSDFTFILINTGKSFAVKINLTFELVNGINAVEEFDVENAQYKYSLTINQPELKQLNPSVFSFKVFRKIKSFDGIYINDYTVDPFVQRVSLLKSNDSYSVQLPSYFLELSNFHMFELTQSMPEVKLTIQYTDQYHTEHTDIYTMKVKYKPMAFSDEKEYFLDFNNASAK